ncbi:MAG: xanthine dehydrogenase family protein molybdopterin-binding subunit [Chloroflexi bacterium]|nr:xanthine dehydrogenase family protein molybdopterin-binding subunit [Chloroflexota bacterium]
MTTYTAIGQPTTRADGPEKVTGKALYSADVPLEGCLWGKVLRSPFAHARIVSIDTSKARAVPGVHAVLMGRDTAGVLYGRRLRDVPPLAHDRVRFIGDPVAAVAAVDEDTALAALALIEVEYEELPAVFDPLEAMQEGAPLLHPGVNSYAGLPQPLARPSNVFVRNEWHRGNMEAGFAQSDLVVEGTYTTPLVHQAYLEPHTCAVHIDAQGRIQVWASNKAPHALRQQLAEAVGIPRERIVLNHAYIGGDFGGKGSPMNVPLCYFLALHAGRPVKMAMDYVEEFMAANPRHPSVITLKTGVKRDGTLVAHQGLVVYNSGAYGGFKPGVNLGGGGHIGGAYRIPNVDLQWLQVYTNTVPGGHYRAPGDPQALFAIESHVDVIARRLGMDPMEFRLKNVVNSSEETPIGHGYEEVKAREVLQAAAEASDYRKPRPRYVGRGMAMGDRGPGGGETHAEVTLHPNGSVTLGTPIFEQGAGAYTMMSTVVGEELGLPGERVQVVPWNTDAVPFDSGTGGSRVTRIGGIAAYQAAQEAKRQMARLAAEILAWPEERVALRGDLLSRQDTGATHPWRDVLARAGRSVSGRASYRDTERSHVTSFVAQVAEVAVDPETGQVKLLRFTTVHDVGRVINPVGHQGQIDGSVVQGIGYALMEELKVEDGRVTSLSFGDYKIPTARDIPEMETVLLESEGGVGPYRIKGIGENPIGPVAAAIANAVEDAVGVRITSLPITPEKVYRAMRERSR